jgi:hypothetical protein
MSRRHCASVNESCDSRIRVLATRYWMREANIRAMKEPSTLRLAGELGDRLRRRVVDVHDHPDR